MNNSNEEKYGIDAGMIQGDILKANGIVIYFIDIPDNPVSVLINKCIYLSIPRERREAYV